MDQQHGTGTSAATHTPGPPGIDVHKVSGWLAHHVPGARAPFTFDLIAGGHSNLTYGVTGVDGTRFVLRRPPLGHVLATAHDMSREERIIAALAPTSVPVPPALGLCEDLAVTGAPFYVMGFVDGHVLRDDETVRRALDLDARRHAGESVVDVLAAIHAVDPDAVGLGDLGRRDGYIARQLRRWYGQWQQSKTRDLPAVDEVHARLVERVPVQATTAIVHGDYRLDNCMLGPDGTVRAVLDWEICTLGDPLADVGLLYVYWVEPGDEQLVLPTAPTLAEGFPTRSELLERYATASGRDLVGIDFYIAFGYWKLACILEGVYHRYVAGVMGAASDEAETFARQVEQLAEQAAAVAARLP